MNPLLSMLLRQCDDWLKFVCFPFTEPGLCTNTRVFLSTHTHTHTHTHTNTHKHTHTHTHRPQSEAGRVCKGQCFGRESRGKTKSRKTVIIFQNILTKYIIHPLL